MTSNESCYHCSEEILTNASFKYDDKEFCCNGCLSVYRILSTNSLEDYYLYKDNQKAQKPNEIEGKFDYLDHEQFVLAHVHSNDEENEFSFFIEGVHCAACLWILERLAKLNSNIISSKLNMGSSVLVVRYKANSQLSEIAKAIKSVGYTPHPILKENDIEKLKEKENKTALLRIAIAFACSGNIMLYSLAIYFGAPEEFKSYFNFFSFLCTIPIVFYCSTPFYNSAFGSIKTKKISIDIPIVIVLILSFVLGAASLAFEMDYFYFDTISNLVFLLLLSRYILKFVQSKALSLDHVSSQYLNQLATRITNSAEDESILAKFIQEGDLLKIEAGELIPCDGVVTSGTSFLNNSVLTGESRPVKVNTGEDVFMGAINLDSKLIMRSTRTLSNSKMGKIIEEVEGRWNKDTDFVRFIDRISQVFVIIVVSLSALFFAYFFYIENIGVALDRTFSLLLITCPCALAISTPLAFILGLSSFLKNGIYIKNEQAIEKFINLKKIFFDKTGTLTDGEFSVEYERFDKRLCSIIYNLEKRSSHPIGKSITKHLSTLDLSDFEISNFQEIAGIGVRGTIENKNYIIKSSMDNQSSENIVSLFEEDPESKVEKSLFTLKLTDSLRPNANIEIAKLKKMGFENFILSGDKTKRVSEVASRVGIKKENLYSQMSPEDKLDTIKNSKFSMMVGDGVNDSIAIQNAYLGVAVSGSTEASLKASDIYIYQGGMERLSSIAKAARLVVSIIKRNILFSLLYNLVGVYLAFTGLVSPVVAAIFMPVSSLTIIFLTVLFSRRLNKLLIYKN